MKSEKHVPLLTDGRQSLVLVSDDNFNRSQTTRVIVLAAENGQLEIGR
jgi:hypothetical protein